MLRRGSIGVGAIHQVLVECGADIDPLELETGVFGPSTDAAVREFQSRHVDQHGHALVDDGIVGPATMWAFAHPSGAQFRYTAPGWRCEPSEARAAVRRVLEVAVGEIGVRETPGSPNRGQRVDVYTAPDLGIPWCAAFVSWCYMRGAEDGSPFGRLLSAFKFQQWGLATGRIVRKNAPPSAGDVFVILRGDGHGHVGLVAGLTVDDRMVTIEGNSGDAVRGLIRPRASVTCVVRPIPMV